MEVLTVKKNSSQAVLLPAEQRNFLAAAQINSDEIGIAKAILSKRFLELNETRQSEILLAICVFIGGTAPKRIEFPLLVQPITERFQSLGEEELSLAFRMNSYNELDKKIEFFGMLTASKLAEVLTLYFRKRENPFYKIERHKIDQQYQPKPVTDADRAFHHNSAVDVFLERFRKFCSSGAFSNDMWTFFILLPDDLREVSLEEKLRLREASIETRKAELIASVNVPLSEIKKNRETLQSYVDDPEFPKKDKARLNTIFKGLFVMSLFERWGKNQASGEEIIQTLKIFSPQDVKIA